MSTETFNSILSSNRSFFQKFFGRDDWKRSEVEQIYSEFQRVYDNRPVQDNKGGAGPIPSFWYFLIAHKMQPKAIIESGVWKGHTTYLFRQACPNAQIYCYDISFNQLQYKDQDAVYSECDWMDVEAPKSNPNETLVFMDDHINQAQRVLEIAQRGYRYAIFDDGVGFEKQNRVGVPAFPSIQMLFDDNIIDGTRFVYELNNKKYTYIHNKSEADSAASKIEEHLVLPNTYTEITLAVLR